MYLSSYSCSTHTHTRTRTGKQKMSSCSTMVQQLCLSVMVVVLAASMPHTALARNSLSRTPPMGWMSWEIFRCETDCANHPDTCISENLYKAQTDALAEGGYVDVGYTGIHMDDCWENKTPKRNATTGRLYPNPDRFPSGLKALGDYMHSKGYVNIRLYAQ